MANNLEAVLVPKQKVPIALSFKGFVPEPIVLELVVSRPINMLFNYFDSAASIYNRERKGFVFRNGNLENDFLNDVERADYRLDFLNRWKIDLDEYKEKREQILKMYEAK